MDGLCVVGVNLDQQSQKLLTRRGDGWDLKWHNDWSRRNSQLNYSSVSFHRNFEIYPPLWCATAIRVRSKVLCRERNNFSILIIVIVSEHSQRAGKECYEFEKSRYKKEIVLQMSATRLIPTCIITLGHLSEIFVVF